MVRRKEKTPDSDDEDDDLLNMSLGFMRINMRGRTVEKIVPYIGWTSVIVAVAFVIKFVLEGFG